MKSGSIRPKALCIIRKDIRFLLEYSKWPTSKDIFYIPLGGEIQYGEYGKNAIQREIKEEIGAGIENIRYLGTIENIYELKHKGIGHEIVLVYEADFTDTSNYNKDIIKGLEKEIEPSIPIVAYWKTIEEVEEEGIPLYPDGLKELLGG